jgi:hypothetical protein
MQFSKKTDCSSPVESKARLDKLQAARQEFEARRKGLVKKPKKRYAKKVTRTASFKNIRPSSSRAANAAQASGGTANTNTDRVENMNRPTDRADTSYLERITARTGTARTGQTPPYMEAFTPLFGRTVNPTITTIAEAISAIEASPGTNFPIGSFGTSQVAAPGIARLTTSSMNEVDLLSSILRQPRAAASGLPTSNDFLLAGLVQQHRMGSMQMLAHARAQAEQSARLQQITDQRRRAVEAAVSRSRLWSSDPISRQIERMFDAASFPSQYDTPAPKRTRYA